MPAGASAELLLHGVGTGGWRKPVPPAKVWGGSGHLKSSTTTTRKHNRPLGLRDITGRAEQLSASSFRWWKSQVALVRPVVTTAWIGSQRERRHLPRLPHVWGGRATARPRGRQPLGHAPFAGPTTGPRSNTGGNATPSGGRRRRWPGRWAGAAPEKIRSFSVPQFL